MSRVSIRYAKAIFTLALEENKLNEVANDIQSLKSLMDDEKDFRAFVKNPLISSLQQMAVVKELFEGRVQVLTSDFLQLICKKKRLNQLSEILNRFEELLMHYKNEVFAEITSSEVLETDQIESIKSNLEKMTNKKVIINTTFDKDLIGGFKVKIEGIIIDNSIKNQLIKLKEKLIL